MKLNCKHEIESNILYLYVAMEEPERTLADGQFFYISGFHSNAPLGVIIVDFKYLALQEIADKVATFLNMNKETVIETIKLCCGE